MSKEDDERKLQDASTADAAAKDPNADIYENRGTKKIIRVVTVMAYLFSVSFVGILLSAYYLFLWEPPNPRLMHHERLRMDPQMQFLIAPVLEKVDPTTEDSFLLQAEVNRAQKPLLSRTMHDDDDDSVLERREKANLEKKNQRLNMVLLKLRHSLVDNLRARNLSRATTAPAELAGFNASDAESTSSTKFVTILETETSRAHLDKDSITRFNQITKEKNRINGLGIVELHGARGLSNATTNSGTTNGGDGRSFENYSFKKKIQEILKIDRKEPVKRNKTDDHRFVYDDQKSDLNNVQTIVLAKARVNDSVGNPWKNNSSKPSSKYRMEQITHDTLSSSQSHLEVTNDPGFRRTHDNLITAKSWSRVARTKDSEGDE